MPPRRTGTPDEALVAIVAVLRDASEELTPKQIAEALSKKEGSVRVLIRKMAQAGEVNGVGPTRTPMPPSPHDCPAARRCPVGAFGRSDAPVAARRVGCRHGGGAGGGGTIILAVASTPLAHFGDASLARRV